MTSYTGDAEAQGGGKGSDVVCVWCGGVIRRAAAKAARRMCQPCFARMMREHSRAHQPRAASRDASER
jgi:hypothetical protein